MDVVNTPCIWKKHYNGLNWMVRYKMPRTFQSGQQCLAFLLKSILKVVKYIASAALFCRRSTRWCSIGCRRSVSFIFCCSSSLTAHILLILRIICRVRTWDVNVHDCVHVHAEVYLYINCSKKVWNITF